MSIDRLPDELCLLILSNSNLNDLACVSGVSRGWKLKAEDTLFWANAVRTLFLGNAGSTPNLAQIIKKYLSKHLRSNTAIIDSIRVFADRVSLGQTARYRCYIAGAQRHQEICVEIKGSTDPVVHVPSPTSKQRQDVHLTQFDFCEDYLAAPLGAGLLNGPYVHQRIEPINRCVMDLFYEGIRTRTYTRHVPEHFYATIKFPILPGNTDLDIQSPMENAIEAIVERKLNNLATQEKRRKYYLYAAVAGGIACISLFLWNRLRNH